MSGTTGGFAEDSAYSQQAVGQLLEAAKEAVIHLRDQKGAHGALFQGDQALDLLVAAIVNLESS